MWQCLKCREMLQQNFDICWNCGTSRDGTEDPAFLKPNEIPAEADQGLKDTDARLADSSRTPLLKQAYDLVPDDFARHPVWASCHILDYDKPWYQETDEATFRPWTNTLPVDAMDATFLLRATVTLANGSQLNGFLTPQSAETPLDLGTMQPALFSPSGEQFSFWDGAFKRSEVDRERFYAALNLSARDIFPVSVSGELGLVVGRVAALISGLCWLKDFKQIEFYS